MLYPENQNKHYNSFFTAIENGEVKLPMFQRDFVWDKEQTARLLDSILKGFPIGTFIFWRTKDELRSYKNIGNHALPQTPKGNYASYILDGQQRITSLYAVRAGLRLTKDGKEIDYKDISVDLDFDDKHDDQIVLPSPPASTRSASKEDAKSSKNHISVHDVLTRKTLDLLDDGYSRAQIEKIDIYKTRLTSYDFSTSQSPIIRLKWRAKFSRASTPAENLSRFLKSWLPRPTTKSATSIWWSDTRHYATEKKARHV